MAYRLRESAISRNDPTASFIPSSKSSATCIAPKGSTPANTRFASCSIRIDLDDTVDRSRLVTKIIYLEDPDQAIPFRLPKDQVSVLTLSPTEPPLRIASALGRPVAIVRMGVRKPTVEEIQAGLGGDVGLD